MNRLQKDSLLSRTCRLLESLSTPYILSSRHRRTSLDIRRRTTRRSPSWRMCCKPRRMLSLTDCDELATAELRWQHLRGSTCRGDKAENDRLSSQRGTRVHSEVPLFLDTAEFRPKTSSIRSAVSIQHRRDRQTDRQTHYGIPYPIT